LRIKYAQNANKVISNHLIASDFLTYNWSGMKFDVVVGNPPFSKVGDGKQAGKRGQELYAQFYAWAIENSSMVAMVMPTTEKKVQKNHNQLLRSTANVIKHIDPDVFPGIVMPMWYVISVKDNPVKQTNIVWTLDGTVGNNIPWVKGSVNMTAHKNLVGDHLGHAKPQKKSDILIYHKVNVTHGLVSLYCDSKYVSQSALFPASGYAVLMPQTFNDTGWSQTEIVKCNGQQAAFNGMNIVFVKTKSQAEKLIEFMTTQ
jgi:hypothetical protein